MYRRRFLLTTMGVLCAPGAALAAPMIAPGDRVRLVDARSGALFDGVYRNVKGPIARAMEELDLFLRDRRTGGVTGIDVGVIDFVAAVMAATEQKTATILSAYRSLQTNALLEHTTFGVADNSQHLYGRALDICFPARLEDAVAVAQGMKRGGVGWYPRSHFVHLDSGPVRNWELGAEGLQDQLTHWPKSTPITKEPKGVMPVKGSAPVTVGGGEASVVSPGGTVRLQDGQLAGVLRP